MKVSLLTYQGHCALYTHFNLYIVYTFFKIFNLLYIHYVIYVYIIFVPVSICISTYYVLLKR